MRAERLDDHPRGPAAVPERASLAQELRRHAETLGRHPGPTRDARCRPDRQRAPDDAGGPRRDGRDRLLQGMGDVGDIRGARVVDRGSDARDDELKAVSGQLRGRRDPTPRVLGRVRLGETRLVERDPALRQRRQPINVSLDEHDVAALFRQADGCHELRVSGADGRYVQPIPLHEGMVADGDRVDAGILSAMDERTPRALPASGRPLLAWAAVVAWATLIFALSAQPNLRFVSDAGLDFVVRKLGHIGVFGILALLSWRALAGTTAWRRPWAWAFALTVLYAASDELHQGFVAGRHPSAADVAIDATGALIALVAVGLIRSRRA